MDNEPFNIESKESKIETLLLSSGKPTTENEPDKFSLENLTSTFSEKPKVCSENEPILELFKGKSFSILIKLFSNDCIDQFGTMIFSIKKSVSRTLTNLLSTWIFSLYVDYDYSSDYFLPTNYENTTTLEIILRDMCKYNNNITDVDMKINNIVTNLKKNYKNQLNMIDEYKKSILYNNNKNNYKIKKSVINLKKNKTFQNTINTDEITQSVVTLFYKFEIKVNFFIKDKRLQNIVNNILLPTRIYDKLASIYTGPKNMMDCYLWSILFRYQLLGSNNHQLAVLPSIMKQMHDDYGLNFECFASTINNTFNHYCSIYYDLERYFGSVGSFFNIIPKGGTFGFNPPYQTDVIELGVTRLFKYLKEATSKLTFFITIPIWDFEGRNIMKEQYNNELEKQNIDYGDFPIIKEIKESEFFKALRMIPKEKFTYIDHNFELYKNKTIQNTYVIILSNGDIDTTKFNEYDFEKIPIE